MIQPLEMRLGLPMEVANKVISTTDKVWEILLASREGDLEKGADPKKAATDWSTPITWAESKDHYQIVNLLKQHI
jgi:hypothetical protein